MEMYGEEWAARFDEMAQAGIPGREGLFRIADACLSDLPSDARILVVGCGTGAEVLHLAGRHPGWRFEAVEPAAAMMAACRRRVEAAGLSGRVALHERPLAGLRVGPCHGATAVLVSQHLPDDGAAGEFFADIAANLAAGGVLYSADISAPAAGSERAVLLDLWRRQAVSAGIPGDALDGMLGRFGRDIAVRPAERVASLVTGAGFAVPVRVFQSLIYSAWVCQRHAEPGAAPDRRGT
jgi:tRNA (cmo5U34)-methyltransferase